MGTDHRPLVLLTGASGYIGGRLLKALEAAGRPVRCLARNPEFLRSRVSSSTEVIQADCLDRASLGPAMVGVQTAYYFVHSMGSAGQFEKEDREAAQNFADAAREQGVERIVYLAAWEIKIKRYPHICGAAMKWQTSCAVRLFRRSSFEPRSSSAPGASRLK
jgi:uncharacterized protein YbjT (DUF2867 family)